MTSLCCALSIQVVGRKKEFKDDSSSGVVVSEGGGIFFGALQNPRPNILVLDVLEVLDAMAALKPKRFRKPERGDLTQSM